CCLPFGLCSLLSSRFRSPWPLLSVLWPLFSTLSSVICHLSSAAFYPTHLFTLFPYPTTNSLPRTPPMLDALVIAPHPAAAELGVGGTIVRLLGQGWKVGILDLTSGEPTPLGTPETRLAETAAANRALGDPWRQNLGLPNRSLEATLENRRLLAGLFRKI